MPRLKDITCNIEYGPKEATACMREYDTKYSDGCVETFVVVPLRDSKFSIHLKASEYISSGLAVFVWMDGVFQCDRNKHGDNLKGINKDNPITDFVLSQKEERISDGHFIAREWRFEKLNIVTADAASLREESVDSIGTIEVVVLRCELRHEQTASRKPMGYPLDLRHLTKFAQLDGHSDEPECNFGLDGVNDRRKTREQGYRYDSKSPEHPIRFDSGRLPPNDVSHPYGQQQHRGLYPEEEAFLRRRAATNSREPHPRLYFNEYHRDPYNSARNVRFPGPFPENYGYDFPPSVLGTPRLRTISRESIAQEPWKQQYGGEGRLAFEQRYREEYGSPSEADYTARLRALGRQEERENLDRGRQTTPVSPYSKLHPGILRGEAGRYDPEAQVSDRKIHDAKTDREQSGQSRGRKDGRSKKDEWDGGHGGADNGQWKSGSKNDERKSSMSSQRNDPSSGGSLADNEDSEDWKQADAVEGTQAESWHDNKDAHDNRNGWNENRKTDNNSNGLDNKKANDNSNDWNAGDWDNGNNKDNDNVQNSWNDKKSADPVEDFGTGDHTGDTWANQDNDWAGQANNDGADEKKNDNTTSGWGQDDTGNQAGNNGNNGGGWNQAGNNGNNSGGWGQDDTGNQAGNNGNNGGGWGQDDTGNQAGNNGNNWGQSDGSKSKGSGSRSDQTKFEKAKKVVEKNNTRRKENAKSSRGQTPDDATKKANPYPERPFIKPYMVRLPDAGTTPPWIHEEPLMVVGEDTVQKSGASHQVRAGQGALYVKETNKPWYTDKLEKPYAVFVFKYRSKEKLQEILPDLSIKEEKGDFKKRMMAKTKDDLLEELRKAKMKAGYDTDDSLSDSLTQARLEGREKDGKDREKKVEKAQASAGGEEAGWAQGGNDGVGW